MNGTKSWTRFTRGKGNVSDSEFQIFLNNYLQLFTIICKMEFVD